MRKSKFWPPSCLKNTARSRSLPLLCAFTAKNKRLQKNCWTMRHQSVDAASDHHEGAMILPMGCGFLCPSGASKMPNHAGCFPCYVAPGASQNAISVLSELTKRKPALKLIPNALIDFWNLLVPTEQLKKISSSIAWMVPPRVGAARRRAAMASANPMVTRSLMRARSPGGQTTKRISKKALPKKTGIKRTGLARIQLAPKTRPKKTLHGVRKRVSSGPQAKRNHAQSQRPKPRQKLTSLLRPNGIHETAQPKGLGQKRTAQSLAIALASPRAKTPPRKNPRAS